MKRFNNQIIEFLLARSLRMLPVILAVLFFILIAGPAIYGMDAQIRMNTGISQTIENELKENCQCEKVDQFFLMRGFQVKKQESFGKRADYKIYNSQNLANLNQEMKRLNKILNKKITDYKTMDLVTFEFINNETHTLFSVKNGKINL